jgi:hypothetical protein
MANQSYSDSLPPRSAPYKIENRNFLSPIGFKFVISRMRAVDFFCKRANIPSVSMKPASQPTALNVIPQPGDELYYDNLRVTFLVDENMKNWYQVHDWMREIATPVSAKEFAFYRREVPSRNPIRRRTDDENTRTLNQWKSDCSLFILSGNYQPIAEFIFHDAFPISLTTLEFDSGVENIDHLSAEVVLTYSHFDYTILEASTATDASMEEYSSEVRC